MQRITPAKSVVALILCALTSTACVTVKKDGSPLDPPQKVNTEREGPWLKGSPALQQSIEANAERLPWTHELERVEMIQWFAQVGEPAFPTLLELAQDPRSDVAGSAYAALGATQDSRLVEPLRRASLPADAAPDLQLERARALLRLGDWSVIPVLISGLQDENIWRRSNSARALWEATRENFGFQPAGTEEERSAAVAQWRAWWNRRRTDPMLDASASASD